jgi:hypothetical protein
MSRYYVNLPEQQTRNAMIDFSPINRSTSEIRDTNQQQHRNAMLDRQYQDQRSDVAYERQRQGKQDQMQQVKIWGERAAAVDREQDPTRRTAMWNRIISAHPDRASLTPDILDPMSGPKSVMAEAGQWRDPREDQMVDLDIQSKRLGVQRTQAEIAKMSREATAGPQVYKDAKQIADVEEGIRKEFTAQSKDFSSIREGYRRIDTGSKIDNGAGDLAIVYGYMKMLDPTSVVREGEFATAENTTGIPAQVLNLYNKVVEGSRLPPEARTRFSDAAKQLYGNAYDQYTQTRSQYEGLAQRKGIDARNVIIDQASAPPQISPSAIPTPVSQDDYERLPSGTRFRDPQGNMRVKP